MNDEAIKVLASLAATALVKAMTSGLWRQLHKRISTILGRGDERREQNAGDQLENSRVKIEAAPEKVNEKVTREVTAEWRCIFSAVLAEHPELAHELRAAIIDTQAGRPEGVSVAQTATAIGGSVVYQAGRDLSGDPAPRERQR